MCRGLAKVLYRFTKRDSRGAQIVQGIFVPSKFQSDLWKILFAGGKNNGSHIGKCWGQKLNKIQGCKKM